MATDTADYWDEQAASFDEQPDHGLLDPAVRAAWAALLLPLLPPAGSSVVDLGCGTGTLSVLLAQAGYDVRGVDLSGQMIAAATRKAAAAGVSVAFELGDAADPAGAPGSADGVLVRHVLWALDDKEEAVGRWVRLLRPGGVLVLVEGRWATGAGVSAAECERIVRLHRRRTVVTRLDDPALWGRTIDDERFVLLSPS